MRLTEDGFAVGLILNLYETYIRPEIRAATYDLRARNLILERRMRKLTKRMDEVEKLLYARVKLDERRQRNKI